MKDDLLQLIYASRNLLPAATAEAEIADILHGSRNRNAALSISGALLFSSDSFVQALEGSSSEIESLFETIQLDPRHADVVILDVVNIKERTFGAWSMAYAGRQDDVRFADLRRMPASAASSAMLELLHGALARVSLTSHTVHMSG